MLFVLSPAKTLDFTPPPADLPATAPEMVRDTAQLAAVTRRLKARDLKRLTTENPGRYLVLKLGDVAFGARRIGQPLVKGNLLMFVETPDDALPALVDNLNETCAAVRGASAQR